MFSIGEVPPSRSDVFYRGGPALKEFHLGIQWWSPRARAKCLNKRTSLA